MMERVIDKDPVAEVDVGVDDEPYRGPHIIERRGRWGVVVSELRALRCAL